MRLLVGLFADGKPLPNDREVIYRRAGASRPRERENVDLVLKMFFHLENDGWHLVDTTNQIASMGYRRRPMAADTQVECRHERVSMPPKAGEFLNDINVPDIETGSKVGGEEEGEGEGDTEPLKGASPPSTTIGALLFNQSKWLVDSSSVPEKSARSLIGRWRKTHGDVAVLTRIEEAQRLGVSNPVEWLTVALRPAPPKPTQRDFN